MSIAFTVLTTGSESTPSDTSSTTASVTPTGSAVFIGFYLVGKTGSSNPTVAGNGLTWTKVGEADADDDPAEAATYIYKGIGTPSTGAITITRASTDTWNRCHWHVVDVSGCDPTTPIVVANIITGQNSNATDSLTLTYPNVFTSGNAGFCVFGAFGGASTGTPGAGWTELADTSIPSSSFLESQYILTSPLTASMTVVDGTGWSKAAVAVEVKASGGTNATPTPTGIGMTSSLGTPVVTRSGVQVSPTGIGMTATLGTPVVGVSVIPTGIGMTSTLGSFSIQNDITLLAVGFGMTASLGTPARVVTTLPSGIGMTMSLGTPTTTGNPTLVPTGLGMTSSLGTPTVTHGSNPTVVPTGVSMTFTLGTPTVSTFQQVTVTPSGFGMVSSLGSPTVSTGNITILLLGDTKQLNTSVRARQLVTTPIVRRPRG